MINRKLADQLKKMVVIDQRARRDAMQHMEDPVRAKRLHKIDGRHLNAIKKIVTRHGVPSISLVGKRGASDFWLLVQHADRDIEFQQFCLTEMNRRPTDFHLINIAYLTDRIRSAQGKKQKFGTQYQFKKDTLILRPLLNPRLVTRWRKEYGLDTLAAQNKRVSRGRFKIKK